MKVKIYVNWYSRGVISEKEFQAKIKEAIKDYKEDEIFFAEWLNIHYSADTIWFLDEEQRNEVQNKFLTKCEELGIKDVRNSWEEKEIEV